MAERLEVYKCMKCGIIVEVLNGGVGTLVCCEEPMKLRQANTEDAAQEKHVPVIEKVEGGIKVTVGSVAHPMTDEHWIQWIELVVGDKVCRQVLNPGDEPSATFFCQCCGCTPVTAREYCNLHGLWKAG
jgi:superoxide reductase